MEQHTPSRSLRDPDPPRLIRATCAPGLSTWLEREVIDLGHEVLRRDHTGVEIKGRMADAMRLNLRLRTAYHVLQKFADLRVGDGDALYERAIRLPWERVVPCDGYVTVTSMVKNDTIRNSMFANMRLKDAIVDRISTVHERRPDAGNDGDRTVVHMYWKGDDCRLYLDFSGRKLSDRGYRQIPRKAPMRETIAAAVLMAMRYDGTTPLLVPMCGSGTIAIEAALMATGRSPGLLRSNHGVKHLLTHDEKTWNDERAAARRSSGNRVPALIHCSDIDPDAVEAARRNARTAGVEQLIDFETCDFSDLNVPDTPGSIVFHGEYGLRLGSDEGSRKTNGLMGDFMKRSCGGWTGFVFTSKDLAGSIGLKARRRTPFENGGVDCRLLEFELYDGTLKEADSTESG